MAAAVAREGIAVKSTICRTLAWVVAATLTLSGCVGPSQEEVDRVRDALDASGLCSEPANVSTFSYSEGLSHDLSVIVTVSSVELAAADLENLLRVIYDNTPDGFDPSIELYVHGPAVTEEEKEWGGPLIDLGPALLELGFEVRDPRPRQNVSFYFARDELDDLFS